MKTKISLVAVSALLFSTAFIPASKAPVRTIESTTVKQVPAAGFSFFRVHRQGKAGITATWGLTSNAGVSGFRVEITYGDPSDIYAVWEPMAMVGAGNDRSYKATGSVYPGYITCRVVAIMTTGKDEIISDYETIHIVSH